MNISEEKTVTQENSTNETKETQEVPLTSIEVNDANMALNVLVSFINLANKRGAFNVQESAKIWECIQQFQKSSSK